MSCDVGEVTESLENEQSLCLFNLFPLFVAFRHVRLLFKDDVTDSPKTNISLPSVDLAPERSEYYNPRRH